jgi:hypothetical protein
MANQGHEECVTIRPLTPLRTRHKVNVVGGARPTGKLPYGVGSGIFGYAKCDDQGIFGERQWPYGNKSGIFFNPYARTNIGLEQPDLVSRSFQGRQREASCSSGPAWATTAPRRRIR